MQMHSLSLGYGFGKYGERSSPVSDVNSPPHTRRNNRPPTYQTSTYELQVMFNVNVVSLCRFSTTLHVHCTHTSLILLVTNCSTCKRLKPCYCEHRKLSLALSCLSIICCLLDFIFLGVLNKNQSKNSVQTLSELLLMLRSVGNIPRTNVPRGSESGATFRHV